MSTLIQALADYVGVLAASADASPHAADRPEYARRMASAARLFLYLHEGRTDELVRLVGEERRAFGWGYLSGETGSAATAAFAKFAATIDSCSLPD